MSEQIKKKIRIAAEKDPDILCSKEELGETLGNNPDYLEDVLGITKSDLIRLERLGLAMKARYSTENKTLRGKLGVTGPHRTRWIIFKEAVL